LICKACRLPVSGDAPAERNPLRAAILAAKVYRNLLTVLPVDGQTRNELLSQVDDQIECLLGYE